MLGVSNWSPHPAALKAMVKMLNAALPEPVSADTPKSRPDIFVTVDRVGGQEIANGTVIEPLFVFQCYALNAGSAEELCEKVLAVLKSAQFTKPESVQFRKFTLVGGPASFPDPLVPGHRRWQFSGTFSMN